MSERLCLKGWPVAAVPSLVLNERERKEVQTISHAYLEGLLVQQVVPPDQVRGLQTARHDIETKLRRIIGSVPRFYYGGSYGKDTMIRVSYDLDIVVYFSHTDSTPVRDIYATVYHGLKNAGYIVQPKTVAIRLPYEGGFHIDVVPGRAQDAMYRYATLYKNPGSTLQTSLKMHIDAVRRPGVREIVRLAKLWRARQGLSWSTFPLEITVVRALAGRPITDYADAVIRLWRFTVANIQTVRLVDPSNTNNVIELSATERSLLVQAANVSLAAPTWSEVLW